MANIDSVNNYAANDPTINKICAELAAQRKQTDAVLGQTKKITTMMKASMQEGGVTPAIPTKLANHIFPNFKRIVYHPVN